MYCIDDSTIKSQDNLLTIFLKNNPYLFRNQLENQFVHDPLRKVIFNEKLFNNYCQEEEVFLAGKISNSSFFFKDLSTIFYVLDRRKDPPKVLKSSHPIVPAQRTLPKF